MSTLLDFRYRAHFAAPPGARGGPKRMSGRAGESLVIKVPVGTVVKDAETGAIVADLVEPDQKVLVAEGGRGGRGNARLATPTRRAPHFCEPGQPGIERVLDLELKLLADVGLVGLPNAGKSSLLSILTAAQPKIASYPFSTLGVVSRPDGDGYVMADLPGLIKGASHGVGLGHKFLRHVERTRLLVHLVDISAEDVEGCIATINEELALYSERLVALPQILVLNKADLLSGEEQEQVLGRVRADYRSAAPAGRAGATAGPLLISCATRQGIAELRKAILENLSRLHQAPAIYAVGPDLKARQHPGDAWSIERRKKTFAVVGDRVSRLVRVTDLRDPESLHHLHQVLRAMGVIEALVAQGAQPGSEVVMGGVTFSFGEEWY